MRSWLSKNPSELYVKNVYIEGGRIVKATGRRTRVDCVAECEVMTTSLLVRPFVKLAGNTRVYLSRTGDTLPHQSMLPGILSISSLFFFLKQIFFSLSPYYLIPRENRNTFLKGKLNKKKKECVSRNLLSCTMYDEKLNSCLKNKKKLLSRKMPLNFNSV